MLEFSVHFAIDSPTIPTIGSKRLRLGLHFHIAVDHTPGESFLGIMNLREPAKGQMRFHAPQQYDAIPYFSVSFPSPRFRPKQFGLCPRSPCPPTRIDDPHFLPHFSVPSVVKVFIV
jgi:hypothetical protein